jgi:hypothetical protein
VWGGASKTLVAVDFLFVGGDTLGRVSTFINADTTMALASLKKLSQCDVAKVNGYHSGLFRNLPNARIAEITFYI